MEKSVKCSACQCSFSAVAGLHAECVTCPRCGHVMVVTPNADDQLVAARLARRLRVGALVVLMLAVVGSSSFCLPILWLQDSVKSNLLKFPPWVTDVGAVLAVVSVLFFFWIFVRFGEAQSVVSITPLAQSRRILVIGLWLLALAFAAYIFAVVTCLAI
jgi:hypothetical protein